MKKLFCLTTLLFAVEVAFAQNSFIRAFTNADINSNLSVVEEPDSGYTFLIDRRYFVNKGTLATTDKNGVVQWSSSYKASMQIMRNMVRTFDDGYVVSARALPSASIYSCQLFKLDNNGNQVWSKRYNRGQFTTGFVIQTADSGLLLYGSADSEIFLMRTNSSGDTIWSKAYGNFVNIFISSVEQTPDLGFIVSGTYQPTNTHNSFLMKTDVDGNIQWIKNYTGPDTPYFKKVVTTSDGGYLVAAWIWDNTDRSLLIKTDSTGNISWSKTLHDITTNLIKKTVDGNYFIAGSTRTRDTADVVLAKLDETGNFFWQKQYAMDSLDSEEPEDAIQTMDGGYMISARWIRYTQGGILGLYIKTDSLGNAPCNTLIPVINSSQPLLSAGQISLTAGSGFTYGNFPDSLVNEAIADSLICESLTSVEENIYSLVQIYPNPASGSILLTWNGSGDAKNVRVRVYDEIGRLVRNITNVQTESLSAIEIDVSGFASGMYFAVLENESGAFGAAKFIKAGK